MFELELFGKNADRMGLSNEVVPKPNEMATASVIALGCDGETSLHHNGIAMGMSPSYISQCKIPHFSVRKTCI